ncbi:MAG: hypothetical protein DI539_20865 [Flavobacterium psychrophilum]|nr:MAG: hypothetical protein DI539_20865 [Flavobacterium psychrophilum]
MACNGCKKDKKETPITEPINNVVSESAYELRSGITYDQLGMKNPSDRQIQKFLEANPNRKSLFKTIPNKADDASKITRSK